MTRVKICGISSSTDAVAAAEAGADYIGLVFAPSRRRVILSKAVEIVHETYRAGYRPQVVGVFANSPAADINFITKACGLDWVQLSGNESWDYCRSIKKPVIKAVHVFKNSTAQEISEKIEEGYAHLLKENLIFLLDSQVKGAYGGTGQTFDWQLAKQVALKYPVIIAGGLTPENVGKLVTEIQPWGVDVSSGVETGGRKDIQKIRDFIQKVKGDDTRSAN